MSGARLNLGCGNYKPPGYVHVDKYGTPDVKHDLETFPWPWDDNSVEFILLNHVLEHLGHDSNVYLRIFQEMYRVCQADAHIRISVPHFRHDSFFDDPTHVRAITPGGLQLFSKRLNREWAEKKYANTPFGLYLDIDFELEKIDVTPSDDWFRLHPEKPVDTHLLMTESALYNNLISQYTMLLRVIKPPQEQ